MAFSWDPITNAEFVVSKSGSNSGGLRDGGENGGLIFGSGMVELGMAGNLHRRGWNAAVVFPEGG